MNNAVLVRTDEARLVATKKLPDDLTLLEYRHLADAIRMLHRGAQWAENSRLWDGIPAHEIPEARLIRAQYGSDWVLIVSIAGSLSTVLLSLAKVVREMSQAAQLNQSMGAIHDAEVRERIANANKTEAETALLRLEIDERRRRLTRSTATEEMRAAIVQVLVESGDGSAQLFETTPMTATTSTVSKSLVNAIRTLATYGIELTVEQD